MEMKKVAAVLLVLFLVSSQMVSIEGDAFDCYDACSTGCVNRDVRTMLRCDRKCAIKCDRKKANRKGYNNSTQRDQK
ncbi:PREDICTED: uncharacterized protein LOC104599900 isoform X2 [Nelumbo nucifera]|uniref:Uncharacterized protein LOC104599900 isoform X2 n=2 Tax=Nelumbo nucifera TaxID=4432 RepID=A0A1U8A3M0_NELNU|nr:PREDICTED: uncharacterized protein LOC104599900 isoform X2 [Nelumbo nucifera]DAD40051.1 TPA_asm: hypothetical protein HUJ06_014374 [Nelumbo nucifera]